MIKYIFFILFYLLFKEVGIIVNISSYLIAKVLLFFEIKNNKLPLFSDSSVAQCDKVVTRCDNFLRGFVFCRTFAA